MIKLGKSDQKNIILPTIAFILAQYCILLIKSFKHMRRWGNVEQQMYRLPVDDQLTDLYSGLRYLHSDKALSPKTTADYHRIF